MTRGEQNVLDDANEFVRQTSDLLEDEPQTSGIRPRPVIEVTETTLDTTRFGFDFGPQPEAQVEPGTQPPSPPPCACPLDSDTLQVVFSGITNNGCVSGNEIIGDPNGTYTVPNVGAGYWQIGPISGVFTLEDCFGGFVDNLSYYVVVNCGHSVAGTQVQFNLYRGVSLYTVVFFHLDSSLCATVLNNDNSDVFFSDGTATISIM